MFKRKCPKCKQEIKDNYEYCPYCGNNLRSEFDQEDYGLLGKNDFINAPVENSSMMDKILENAFKMAERMLEKHMKNLSEEMIDQAKSPQKSPDTGLNVQFFVNGKRVMPTKPNAKAQNIKIENDISEDKIKKFSKLPKKEPDSKVRRLSGKVIYEFSVPGVDNIKDIMVNQLENSIEIKALGKDRVYQKTLNVNLPILSLQLEEGNLILELQANN